MLVGDDALMDELDPSERQDRPPPCLPPPPDPVPTEERRREGATGIDVLGLFIKVVVAGCAIFIIWYVWAVSHFTF